MGLIEQLRQPKIGPFAIFDFAASLAVAALVAPRLGISRERAMWAVIPASVATHVVLGIDTPLTRQATGPGDVATKAAVAYSLWKATRS